MPYYPKSRIIEDQKANPGQFITADGKSYSGPYYTTFDGKVFTGKNPYDGASRPLIPAQKSQDMNPKLSYLPDAVKFRTLSSNAPAKFCPQLFNVVASGASLAGVSPTTNAVIPRS
jgi:hypothetical protein